MRTPTLRHWLALGLAMVLTACGGGGDSGVAPQSGEIVTTGTITGFGSVYVNGTRYDTVGASIDRDDEPATQQDLRVGQIVTLSGTFDSRTGKGRANSIRQDDNLEGPITSLDPVAQSFVVLAQIVKVTPETSFDDDLAGFAALAVGLQVEVSGLVQADGSIVATRVERRRPGRTELEILGRVAAIDTVARRFQINALVVDYSGASLRDFGSAGIANGQLVEVEGNALDAGGALLATEVELHHSERGPRTGNREFEGLITRFVSVTDFDVAGRPVTTTSATRYEDGTAAMLALNVKVEVEGSLNEAGVLVAREVEFKRGGNAGVAGLVESVTPDAAGLGGTLVVLGVTVTVDSDTRIEDKSDADIEMFRLADLRPGDQVRVRGSETAALRLTASRLERHPPRAEVWVRGTVRDLAQPAFTALGVPVLTNGTTEFDDMSAADFFANGAGRVVKAKGTLVNGQLVAREVEYEDSDDYDDDDGGDDSDDDNGDDD